MKIQKQKEMQNTTTENTMYTPMHCVLSVIQRAKMAMLFHCKHNGTSARQADMIRQTDSLTNPLPSLGQLRNIALHFTRHPTLLPCTEIPAL